MAYPFLDELYPAYSSRDLSTSKPNSTSNFLRTDTANNYYRLISRPSELATFKIYQSPVHLSRTMPTKMPMRTMMA